VTTRCTVCQHRRLADITRALETGQSGRSVAAAFGLGLDAVQRHVRRARMVEKPVKTRYCRTLWLDLARPEAALLRTVPADRSI
jgi:hypothetical protein